MKNFIQEGKVLPLVCSHPAVPTSGCVCRFGNLLGVAVLNEGEGGCLATETMVQVSGGVYDLNVLAEDNNGASAVAVGDALYYVDADAHLSKKTTSGYFFGYALEVNASGHDVINVLHVPAPGVGTTPADGTVTAAKLGANAVGTAALSATLGTGFIPIDIMAARVIAANDLSTVLAAATDPILKRFNGATDKSVIISWESGSVIEIQLPGVPYPPDLDDTQDVIVHLLGKMKAGSVNTPVFTLSAWEGNGDTNMGGNTGALSTTMQDLSVTLATANISAHPNVLNLSVLPGAHATASNDVHLYAAWVEYTRK
jgi:predicted RecA/RadA family phage recombinase